MSLERVIEKLGKRFLKARDPFLCLVKLPARAEPCRQRQHGQFHALMGKLLTGLLREPHDITRAIEALVVGSEHGNDDIGQENGANAANVAQARPAIDEDKIKVPLPLRAQILENDAAVARGEESVPVKLLEMFGILRILLATAGQQRNLRTASERDLPEIFGVGFGLFARGIEQQLDKPAAAGGNGEATAEIALHTRRFQVPVDHQNPLPALP